MCVKYVCIDSVEQARTQDEQPEDAVAVMRRTANSGTAENSHRKAARVDQVLIDAEITTTRD